MGDSSGCKYVFQTCKKSHEPVRFLFVAMDQATEYTLIYSIRYESAVQRLRCANLYGWACLLIICFLEVVRPREPASTPCYLVDVDR